MIVVVFGIIDSASDKQNERTNPKIDTLAVGRSLLNSVLMPHILREGGNQPTHVTVVCCTV